MFLHVWPKFLFFFLNFINCEFWDKPTFTWQIFMWKQQPHPYAVIVYSDMYFTLSLRLNCFHIKPSLFWYVFHAGSTNELFSYITCLIAQHFSSILNFFFFFKSYKVSEYYIGFIIFFPRCMYTYFTLLDTFSCTVRCQGEMWLVFWVHMSGLSDTYAVICECFYI